MALLEERTVACLSPFLWIDGQRSDRIGHDVAPNALYGHFAVSSSDGKRHRLARDPMGVHKLFFALAPDGSLDTDVWLHELLKRAPPKRVFSAPSHALLELDLEARTLTHTPYPQLALDTAASEEEAAHGIEAALGQTFERIAEVVGACTVYLTLSGGLDSSTIAAFATRYLPREQLTCVTLHVDDGRPVARGTDLHAARTVAARLGLPLLELVTAPESILELLDDVLLFGQDFRDFNVHCALVNAAIARALRTHGDAEHGAIVLTGDGANELLSDYEAVDLEGRSYYALPKLPRSALRRFLVRGLDAGDREVGVFARYGLRCMQPFLLAARAFLAVPGAMVDDRSAKSRLARRVLRDSIPDAIFERPKVRAQCGREGEPSGAMAALVRAGVDQEALIERFTALYGVDRAFVRSLIRAGTYRAPQRFEQLL